jgi:hypothetical protein
MKRREWCPGAYRVRLLFSEPFQGAWIGLAWRREVLKTSVRVLRSVAVTGREGVNGNRNQRNSLSTMESVGSFGNSIEWLLTG